MINEETIISWIQEDKWMMDMLKTAKLLDLPDWWICAGFVRSKVWDVLHNFSERTPYADIDVIYFNEINISEAEEKKWEEKLRTFIPDVPWSVKNQARMHKLNNLSPYTSSEDGISKFPETATALGVKLDANNNVILTAPWGIQDLIQMVVRPTPFFLESKDRMQIYEERLSKKNWKRTWSKLKIY